MTSKSNYLRAMFLILIFTVPLLTGCRMAQVQQTVTSRKLIDDYLKTDLMLEEYTLQTNMIKEAENGHGSIILYTVTEEDGTSFTAYDWRYQGELGKKYRQTGSDYDAVHFLKYMNSIINDYRCEYLYVYNSNLDKSLQRKPYLVWRFKDRADIPNVVSELNEISAKCSFNIQIPFIFQFDDEEFLNHYYSFPDEPDVNSNGFQYSDIENAPNEDDTFEAGDELDPKWVEQWFCRYGTALRREDVMSQYSHEEIVSAIKENYNFLTYDPIVLKQGTEYYIFEDLCAGSSDDCESISLPTFRELIRRLGYTDDGNSSTWEDFVSRNVNLGRGANGYEYLNSTNYSFDMTSYTNGEYEWSRLSVVPDELIRELGYVGEIARRNKYE